MFRSRCRSVVAGILMLCAAWSATPVLAQSFNKLALSHVAPDECIFFFTWNGWATPNPKSTNRTERLLAEESLQDFSKQLGAEIDKLIDNATAMQGNEEATVASQSLRLLAKTALKHPGAIYLSSFKPADDPQVEAALIVNAEQDGPQAIESIKKLINLAPKEGMLAASEEKIGGMTFHRQKEYRLNEPHMRVGFLDSHLIVTFGDETPKVVAAKLSKPGKAPAWLTQISQELAVDRPAMLTYFNAQALLKTLEPVITDPMAPKILEALGIDKLKQLSSVLGLDKTGLQINSQLTTDGTPTGLFNLLPDKPLTIDTFKKIPATSVNATVVRLDLDHLFEQVLKGVEQVDPNVRQQIEGSLAQIEPQLGFSVKNDVLKALGDTWSIYVSGSEPGVMMIPGFVITASVRNQENLTKALEVVVKAARGAAAQAGPQAPFTIQEFSARGEKGYRIQFQSLPLPVAPAWVVTKDQIVIGITPQVVTSHLSAANKTTLADNDSIKAAFKWQPKPLFVSYSDPKPGLQGIYTLVNTFGPLLTGQLAQQGINFNLPPLPPLSDLEQHLAPSVTTIGRSANGWKSESHGVFIGGVEAGPAVGGVAVALLLPAVQQAREAARRSQSKNNLKQIGLAMHNFHDTYRAFPAAASTDKKGKQLLSWRVHILPYVEANDLYQQFHLEEPWDSEHNKTLIEKMPQVYQSTNDPELNRKFKTRYIAPRGAGTVFEKDGKEGEQTPLGLGFRDITDGTSNTIMVVEAHPDAAVDWTKPDDLVIDVKDPLKGLKSARVGGFHALLCDGSVRFISDSIDLETLKRLFIRNDGQPIGEF